MPEVRALDLFAGTGWGVACKRLGIKEMGVEIMPEAIETRKANGMFTIYNDVWDGLLRPEQVPAIRAFLVAGGTFAEAYDLLIASPPCQTFSVAGKGAGRKALDEVLEAIELHAYKDPEQLLAFGEKHDMRTALVLTPLAHIWRDRPRLVALEQVPTVLPVWEAYADVMAEWGYSVKTAVLNAEQYGVPQTRKRAILVARLDGEAQLPIPTHSRYYSNNPSKLDPGVQKWVSMAEALGWGRTVPSPTFCNSQHGGAGIEWGGNSVRKAMRAQSETLEGWEAKPGTEPGTNDAIRVSVEEAATLQSYPTAIKNMGSGMVERYGERPGREGDQPAFTIRASAGGTEPGGFVLREVDGETRKLTTEEAATLQSYPTGLRPEIAAYPDLHAPAPTVCYRPEIAPRGCKHPAPGCCSNYPGKPGHQYPEGTVKITVDEASALQSFPTGVVGFPRLSDGKAEIEIDGKAYRARDLRDAEHPSQTVTEKARSWKRYTADGEVPITTEEAGLIQTYERPFVWKGSKTKQFLQIGNAVPPLLAQVVLAELVKPTAALPVAETDLLDLAAT